jgi:uncharacterized C2H2 Zn-finger protein
MYYCEACDKGWDKKKSYLQHMRRSHPEDEAMEAVGRGDYECPHCPSLFETAGELNTHMATHGNLAAGGGQPKRTAPAPNRRPAKADEINIRVPLPEALMRREPTQLPQILPAQPVVPAAAPAPIPVAPKSDNKSKVYAKEEDLARQLLKCIQDHDPFKATGDVAAPFQVY